MERNRRWHPCAMLRACFFTIDDRINSYPMLPTFCLALTALSLSVLLAACPSVGDDSPGFAAPPPGEGARGAELQVAVITDGLEHPWGIAFLPGDEGILVTERPGRLRLIRNGQLQPQPVGGLPPIRGDGEGGLLDVALHPEFESNRLVYVSYSKPGDRGATTAVARGRFQGGRLTAVQDVFVADAWGPSTVNYGGRIVFDRNGYLFLTIGDRRDEARAQDLGDHVGTTVRLHDDGRIPADNPFVGQPGARPEIFSYGHRNSQGMIVHPSTGEIWQTDSGPAGGDEINIIRAGANYGWPIVSFGNHYDGRPIPDPTPGDGTTPPQRYWNPGISPSGMLIYTGRAYPDWQGDLFVGSLAARHLNRTPLDGSVAGREDRLLADRGLRIRAVVQGPDELLYLLVDAVNGALLRPEPGGVEVD